MGSTSRQYGNPFPTHYSSARRRRRRRRVIPTTTCSPLSLVLLLSMVCLSLRLCSMVPTTTGVTIIATTVTSAPVTASQLSKQQQQQRQQQQQQREVLRGPHSLRRQQEQHQRHLQEDEHPAGILGPGAGVGGQHAEQLLEQEREDALHQQQQQQSGDVVVEQKIETTTTNDGGGDAVLSSSSSSSDGINQKTVMGITVGSLLGGVLVLVSMLMIVRRRKIKLQHSIRLSELQFSMTGHNMFNNPRLMSGGSWFSSTSSSGNDVDSFGHCGDHEDTTEVVIESGSDVEWGDEITQSDRIMFHPKFVTTTSSHNVLDSGSGHSLKERSDGGRGRPSALKVTGLYNQAKTSLNSSFGLSSSLKGSMHNKNKKNKTKNQKVAFATGNYDADPSTDLSDLL